MRRSTDSEFLIVTLKVEDRPDGGISVTSADVPGLLLSGADRKLIWSVVGLSVERLLRVNKSLDVVRALLPQEPPPGESPNHVAVEVEIAVQLALTAA